VGHQLGCAWPEPGEAVAAVSVAGGVVKWLSEHPDNWFTVVLVLALIILVAGL
jgi:CHASE2 domain-containing sensor protein